MFSHAGKQTFWQEELSEIRRPTQVGRPKTLTRGNGWSLEHNRFMKTLPFILLLLSI
jgi:hypothetical protein